MKSTKVFFLAAVLVNVLCSSPAIAQRTVSVSAGVNAPMLGFSGFREEAFFRDYWPFGFNAGATVQMPVTKWMLLAPTAGYKIYPFQRFHQTIFVGTTTLLGSTGEPIQQLRIGLGVRLRDPAERGTIRPFVELNGGYELERAGKLSLLWQEQGGTRYTTVSAPEYRHAWVYGYGFGMQVSLSSRISLEPSLLWHASGEGRNYALAALEVNYGLTLVPSGP